jgi:four helix bundle protein
MGTFQSFEEIEAWQKARSLAREIYAATGEGAFSRDFSLRDQIRRAAVSVMSNIAEGYERSGTGEFVHFLSMAKGSTGEVRSQLYVALDQGFITQPVFDRLAALAIESGRLIGGLMNYLKHSKIKGTKYKQS